MDREQLLEQLKSLCVSADADVSVLWRELGADTDAFAFESEKIMASASMIKVPIMLAVLNEVKQGKLSLSQTIEISDRVILNDSEVFNTGGRSASIEELATWMIILSDNTSTNALIDLLGYDAVNAYCAEAGAVSTSLHRKMLDFAAIKEGRNNFTTARDMYLLYSGLGANTLLTQALCETALGILKKQRHKKLMPRYIWEDAVIAHKTGGLDYLTHDAGIFYVNGKKYFLGVFLQNCADIGGDAKRIGKIARLIFDYYLGAST